MFNNYGLEVGIEGAVQSVEKRERERGGKGVGEAE